MTQTRIFSAPGKAFLAGGYLVLDASYEAFVVALSSRMHAATSVQKANDTTTITVKSPQFKEGEWSFNIDLTQFKQNKASLKEKDGRRNPFVESTISTILSYLQPIENYTITITIFSDSGYHSQVNSVPKSSTNKLRTFQYHSAPITEVSKTGLGSSAGLVTSLTIALLSCYDSKLDIKDEPTLLKVHNLAQVAHCLAQGKVGSGFDVATATFGSIVYRRFNPSLINDLSAIEDNTKFSEALVKLVDETNWKITHNKCCLPSGIKLLMGDIVGGSETPKLVSKVLAWRKAEPEKSLELWTNLNNANMSLVSVLQNLQALSKENPERYQLLLKYLNNNSAIEIDQAASEKKLEFSEVEDVIVAIRTIRKYLKQMTVATGAEIEPDEQTELLDATESLTGCLGGVVPGAGGYDAICILVGEESVKKIAESTKGQEKFKSVKWLDLEEQAEGIVEEDPKDFEGLI
ncbi:unnamed protein product [Ambrosiozyma monospora]|uniref:Unnamed protein product n=1 Tax=Ambrosiozyma monospora TaxID=43982 RepID=A0ACB5T281_AMBMO|nr:unnamed protein product [Ambrosiozyma monospora]